MAPKQVDGRRNGPCGLSCTDNMSIIIIIIIIIIINNSNNKWIYSLGFRI
jgi:hypothetical protein